MTAKQTEYSPDSDRQPQLYPTSVARFGRSEIPVDRWDRIVACHRHNINYPTAISQSLTRVPATDRAQVSVGFSRRSSAPYLDNDDQFLPSERTSPFVIEWSFDKNTPKKTATNVRFNDQKIKLI